MSLYKNPWSPGYAIPGYVDAEPRGRGTFTTAQTRRRTISEPPKGWTGGYALPPNADDEPAGQGTITTKQIKRRTISQFIPDYLLDRVPGDALAFAQTDSGFGPEDGELPGMSGLGSPFTKAQILAAQRKGVFLENFNPGGLGAVDITTRPVTLPGFPGDPIAAYGREIAAYIMQQIRGVHAPQRVAALRELFDKIDGSLWTTVAQKAEVLEAQGMSAKGALQRAMAASLADGFAREIVNIGLTGKVPTSGQAGIAAFGCATSLGSFWSKVKSASSDVLNFTKDVGKFVEKVGCRTLNSSAAPFAAGLAGQAAGVPAPVGAQGAVLARDVAGCSNGSSAPKSAPPAQYMSLAPAPVVYQQPPAPGFPLGMVALGGAAILGVYLMRKKR
jgi:hypothetical protein